MNAIILVPGEASLADWRAIYRGATARLDGAAAPRIAQSAAAVARILAKGEPVYGINTGFGKLASVRIGDEDLATLQRNIVLSHAAGTGAPSPVPVIRLMMALKLASLGQGASGVQPQTVALLEAMLVQGLTPVVPAQGSVGASGDLAPLSHMAAAMIGVGEIMLGEERLPAAEALVRAGLAPLELGPKEGLALLNGTQVSTALALVGLFQGESVFAAGLVAGCLTLEAIKGSVKPFDARIHEARGQLGQIAVAAAVRELLDGSAIDTSHPHCGRVQDPYSIRCVPQVMGACLDNLSHAARVLVIEANAASDNPLVFDNGDVISGGNFHAEPVAFAADIIALALAEIGAISERRMALLLDTGLSGLPAFLIADSGVNSGFMIAQVTAAALAAENQCLAHPSSVTSLPTSANQEDHVSMATYGARRLGEMARNTAVIVGVEAMAAAQGMDFDRSLNSSELIEAQYALIRSQVPHLDRDRYLAPDIETMRQWALATDWPQAIVRHLPSHQAA